MTIEEIKKWQKAYKAGKFIPQNEVCDVIDFLLEEFYLSEQELATVYICGMSDSKAEIDRLKRELEESICKQKIALHNARLYDDKCHDLECQLAEAKTEVDYLRDNSNNLKGNAQKQDAVSKHELIE